MLSLKHFFLVSLILSLIPLASLAASDQRANHHKLKDFLDCEVKNQGHCELEKPERPRDKKVVEQTKSEHQQKERSASQKFIFRPSQKRVKKGKASAR